MASARRLRLPTRTHRQAGPGALGGDCCGCADGGLLCSGRIPPESIGWPRPPAQTVQDECCLPLDEVVFAEKIDRISRLSLVEAERLADAIRNKGARLPLPGIVDLSDLAAGCTSVAEIVLGAVHDMLLRLALQTAPDDHEDHGERQRRGIVIARRAERYNGRTPDTAEHRRIVAICETGKLIAKTAALAGCSVSQVERATALHRNGREGWWRRGVSRS